MVGCAAFDCSNQSAKGFLMKNFPRDPKRRKLWAEKVKRKNWIPTDNSRLCEAHFAPEMWEKPRVDGKRVLKWNAVPTIFKYTKEVKERRTVAKKQLSSRLSEEVEFEPQPSCFSAEQELTTHTLKHNVGILNKLKENDIGFEGGLSTLSKVLKRIGFKWKRSTDKRQILVESYDIRGKRIKYRRQLPMYMREGRSVVFTDESYIHSSHTQSKEWADDSTLGLKKPISKGQRLIMVYAGGREGFIPNALLIFPSGGMSYIKKEFEDDGYMDNKVFVSETAISANDDPLNVCIRNDLIKQEFYPLDIKVESLPEVHNSIINESVEAESKVNGDNELLFCEHCQTHYDDYCTTCGMLVHILNRNVHSDADSIAQGGIPKDVLEIRDSSGQFGIFALKVIPEGVKFGPLSGLDTSECPWKIRRGKFVVTNEKSVPLNWMQYINPARSVSEQNLRAFQCENNLYYESSRNIQKGDELLVYFGNEYEDSVNKDFDINFTPADRNDGKDVFACTFCCLGFSSRNYLADHKIICLHHNLFSIEELTQCPFCKIYLGEEEYFQHHLPYCCKRNDRECYGVPLDDQANETYVDPLKCSECEFSTRYKAYLRRHIRINHSIRENNYKCPTCNYTTSYKPYLTRHIRNKHCKELNYKCATCEYKTSHKLHLENHIKTVHLEEFSHKCTRCDFKTNYKSNFAKHMKRKHLKECTYRCIKCEFKSNYKANLQNHFRKKHLSGSSYKCYECDYSTQYKASLQVHIKTVHLKECNYKCTKCDFHTNYKSNFQRHIERTHLEVCIYKCDECGFTTNYKLNYQRHIDTVHLKTCTYKCDCCEFTTNYKTNLQNHLKAKHLKEFNYECESCDFKSNLKWNLEYHVKTKHIKDTLHACSECDFRTHYAANLKTHMKVKHLKEFRYKCESCGYGTNRKEYLDNHVKTKHLKAFDYKCEECPYMTNLKCHLKLHVNRSHVKNELVLSENDS